MHQRGQACDTKLLMQKGPNTSLTDWLLNINQKRQNTGRSVAMTDYKFEKCRVRQLKGPNIFPGLDGETMSLQKGIGEGGLLYWMNRDQRVQGSSCF